MYASSILMAFYWLLIVGILILTYYSTYIYRQTYDRSAELHTVLSGGIAAALLAVTFLFTCNLALMVNPESWPAYFDNPQGTLLNLTDPTLIPRFLHTVLASLAVGGLAIALYSDFKKEQSDTASDEGVAVGMNWFAWATILNFGVGTWYWGSLPESVRALSGTGGAFFLIFLLLGIVGAIFSLIYGLLHRVRPALYCLLAALFCMVLVREFARRLSLAPWFKTSDLEIVPQYSPLIVFLLIFTAGVALIWYMIRLVLTDKEVRS